jgi:hypothetical protein
MSNVDTLHPLSRPVATMFTTGAGSAAGIIVAAHVGHPTAASVTSGAVAGAVTAIGGVYTVAWVVDPIVRMADAFFRSLMAPPSRAYQR